MNQAETLLEIKDLCVEFKTMAGTVRAVDHLSYRLKQGEKLGIVGESGSGKSVFSLAMMQLIPNPPGKVTGGQILYQGKDLVQLSEREMQKIRGNEISMIFQEPMTSLNPIIRCGKQIAESLRHLILPGIVLAAFTMGLITRTTRSNLLDALSTDYIRTAKAKGLGSLGLIIGHALGNALIPVMTVIGLELGNLLGGMVLVETIFKWPGVGQFAYESVMAADYPAIIGVALLIALNYMIINTVVDILYGIIDPRVRCSE